MAEELKACPFCGGEAEIERVGTARMSTIYFCTECSCRLETGETFNHGALWNRRAMPSQGGEAVAVVHEQHGFCWYEGKKPAPGTKLYTKPADQVDGVVVSRELLERIVKRGMRLPDETQHQHLEELRALLAKP